MSKVEYLKLAVELVGPSVRDKDIDARSLAVIDIAEKLYQYSTQELVSTNFADESEPVKKRGRPAKSGG